MKTIETAIETLLRAEELETHRGIVTEADVDAIALATGCSLPSDYKHFLLRCGFAIWVGHSVYGVYDPPDERFPESFDFSAVRATLAARTLHADDPYPFMNHSVVIDVDGMMGYFLLVSENKSVANRVVWVDYDETWVVTREWSTFAEFLDYQAAL